MSNFERKAKVLPPSSLQVIKKMKLIALNDLLIRGDEADFGFVPRIDTPEDNSNDSTDAQIVTPRRAESGGEIFKVSFIITNHN